MPSVPNSLQDPIVVKKNFFLDSDGILYKRKTNDKHQLIVPETLISGVIKENHDPVYISHPGAKRTRHGTGSQLITDQGPAFMSAFFQETYRLSQEERTKLREGVPYVKLYRYNPKHLYPKLNGYGDNGK